jgi:hypothetical protein
MGRAGGELNNLTLDRGSLRLDFPTEEQGFSLTRKNDLVLIVPRKDSKRRGEDWLESERNYRSMVLDNGGYVRSAGLPKFFNAGENEKDTLALASALQQGEEVWITEKVDGSLAVRSVIDGKVIFRTRGTLDGGEHGPYMLRVAKSRYPRLLDPDFMPNHSLHFEFVSLNFRIVIRYEEDDLVFLGSIDHKDLRLSNRAEAQAIAEAAGLNLVEAHPVPTSLAELAEQIESLEGREGVVASCQDGQLLVKLKSAYFLSRHRLLSHLTAKRIREVCLEEDIRSISQFEKWVTAEEGDWEIVKDAQPLIETYLKSYAETEMIYSRLAAEVEEKKKEFPERKDFARLYALTLERTQRAAAFMLFDGKMRGDHPRNALNKPGSKTDPFSLLLQDVLDRQYAAFEEQDNFLIEDE